MNSQIMTLMQESDLQVKICDKCGTPIEHIISIGHIQKKVPVNCQCKREAYLKKQEEDANFEKMKKLEKLKAYSLMDDQFKMCTFENWVHENDDKIWYELAKQYCDNWLNMKKENVGMLLHGDPGTGKSYMSFCIANELLKKSVPVIATSSINIINKIYESYGRASELGEVEFLNQLQNASLLIIDDLGAEHEGRTGKEKQILYSVIDSRIRAKKPIIITTNLTPKQLNEKLTGTDGVSRTYDRIVEACPPIAITGKSRRVDNATRKLQLLRGLVS